MIPPFEQLQTDQPKNNLFLILFSLASLLAFFVEGLLVVHSSVGTDMVIWVAFVLCEFARKKAPVSHLRNRNFLK